MSGKNLKTPDTEMSEFSKRLKLLRTEQGLTQPELASAVKISARVFGYYETDNRFPKRPDILIRIADHFGVSADWLLGRTETKYMREEEERRKTIDCNDFSEDEIAKILDYIDLLRLSHSKK